LLHQKVAHDPFMHKPKVKNFYEVGYCLHLFHHFIVSLAASKAYLRFKKLKVGPSINFLMLQEQEFHLMLEVNLVLDYYYVNLFDFQ
jgi:hypothetical protein